MARRRIKKRTHVGAYNKHVPSASAAAPGDKIPKSMVLRIGAGEVGPSISQLVKDVREVMEPHTASRLKERRSNKLKDYITMAGPLGVTHLLLFSRSSSGNTNLRITLAPRGPTFFFHVDEYSLCKDVKKAMKHPKEVGKRHLHPPLLVMNNMLSQAPQAGSASSQPPPPAAVPKHLETLTTSMFQSLFPAISPQDAPLSSIRRVLLLNRLPPPPLPPSSSPSPPSHASAGAGGTADAGAASHASPPENGGSGNFVIDFRHYAISTKPAGLSKGMRRLRAAEKLLQARQQRARNGGGGGGSGRPPPDFSRLQDMADYILDPGATGYTSGSESEDGGGDAEVEVLEVSSGSAKRRGLSIGNSSGGGGGIGGTATPATTATTATPTATTDTATSTATTDAAAAEAAARKRVQAGGARVERRAVRLHELGPRMKLRLVKVEEGLCGGRVMWHDYMRKTPDEARRLDAAWEQRRRDKAERRRQQQENVALKKEKGKKRRGRLAPLSGAAGGADANGDLGDDYEDDFEHEDDDGEGDDDDADDVDMADADVGDDDDVYEDDEDGE